MPILVKQIIAISDDEDHNSEMDDSAGQTASKITKKQKLALVPLGVGILGVGTYGILKSNSQTGFTVLAIVGSGIIFIAIRGDWPNKISKDGVEYPEPTQGEVAFKMLEGAIETEGANENVIGAKVEALKNVQDDFLPSVVDSQGGYSFSEYDLQLQIALKNLFPGTRVRRAYSVSGIRPDFQLDFENISIWLETKFLKPDAKEFKGITLDPLIENIPPGKRLLVIANVKEVQVAREKLKTQLGADRVEVICWRGPQDNAYLASAIDQLIN